MIVAQLVFSPPFFLPVWIWLCFSAWVFRPRWKKWQEVRRVFPHSATVAADNSRAGWQARGSHVILFFLVDFPSRRWWRGKKSEKMQSSADTLPGESGEGRGFNLLLGFLASASPNGPAVSPLSEQGRNQSFT